MSNAIEPVEMTFTKSTKRTHVYSGVGDTSAIPSLYIQQTYLPNPPPQRIKITIKVQEE